ncbi:MAG: Branched-chain amino acid ABC-type transport system, permease component [Mesotoga infera]|jgi:branched-chain amino acid transport system permease protein|uniref:Branched-chain amino acid ABC-type transport system, permease component n=1 Tax=Mesotoga infera TaxID=1236046 RepID=A0A101H096_9BACT|nr:MAG: Branched-chain amino acid ABC-type transport system, permease component [Mesotoga infera]KUK90468.1 MAG: Branched-chain amino acid ABC-type transport system, permease component [Mesotoga infera]
MLQDILQNIVSGASIGATYGLVGLGVVFLWLTISRINFANISSAMLGAYLFYSFYTQLNLGFFISFVLSIAVIAVYGLGLRVFIYEPIRKRGGGRLEFVVATLMLCTFWLNLIIVTYGALPKPFPPVFGGSNDFISLGGIRIPTLYLNIYLVIGILMVFIYFLLNKTLIGKSFRAAAQNREAAALMGIDVKVTTSLSFILATVVVGIAGILLAPIYFVSLELGGGSIGVKGFASAVLGGLTNPYGTILGGISLGLLENFSTLYISSTYRDIISFSVLVAVLILKPSGIFNWKSKKI